MYVCVQSNIDNLYRVMEKADAPYGICFSVGETASDAIADGARFLGIDPSEILNENCIGENCPYWAMDSSLCKGCDD